MFDGGEIRGGMAGPDATLVLPEGYVQDPVQAVFDLPVIAPVIANVFRYVLGTVIERCDVKRPDRFGFITDFTYAPGHDRGFQAWPMAAVPEPSRFGADRMAARLNSPVISSNGLAGAPGGR